MKIATVFFNILAGSLLLLPFSSAYADREHDNGHHYGKHYNKHYEKFHEDRHYHHHPERYEYYDNGHRYFSYYCEKHHHKMRCYDQRRRHPHFVYVPVTRVVQVVPAAPVTQYVETAPVTRVVDSPRYNNNVCGNCGVVVSVNTVHVTAGTNGVGAVAGAVVGGLLGNQVGGGDGKKVATVAGAVVGGVVGNEIERNNSQSYNRYDVKIKMENGSLQTMSYNHVPEWHKGDRVWLENGQLSRRR